MAKYYCVLFDADNTLLNFDAAESKALAETLEHAYADPDFCAFADLYGKGRNDKPAGDTILQV